MSAAVGYWIAMILIGFNLGVIVASTANIFILVSLVLSTVVAIYSILNGFEAEVS